MPALKAQPARPGRPMIRLGMAALAPGRAVVDHRHVSRILLQLKSVLMHWTAEAFGRGGFRFVVVIAPVLS